VGQLARHGRGMAKYEHFTVSTIPTRNLLGSVKCTRGNSLPRGVLSQSCFFESFGVCKSLNLREPVSAFYPYSVSQLYVLQASTMGKPASGILRRHHRERLCHGLVQYITRACGFFT
jgi:hypothetical protein